MTLRTGKQIIEVYILPNVSKSKDNQAMKFGQLIECNMRSIFIVKSHTKCGREISPILFPKKSKLGISLDQQSNFFFYSMSKSRAIEIYCN